MGNLKGIFARLFQQSMDNLNCLQALVLGSG
jgi:hypothetical protein